MRPPDSRPQIDAIMTNHAAATRFRISGTGQSRCAGRGKQRLVERLLPLGVARVELCRCPSAKPDVVDEHIKAAKGDDRFSHDVRDAIGGREIGGNRKNSILLGGDAPELGGRRLERLLAASANRDQAAFLHQRSRARQSDAPARAGDDGDLAGQLKVRDSVRRVR